MSGIKQLYSNGAHFLGLEIITKYFEEIIKRDKNLPIFSIGSGNGLLESKIDEIIGTNIICVDNNPLSWSHIKKFI